MKGSFKTREEIDAFVSPLKTIGALIDEGIVLNFKKENDGKVNCSISALNSTKGTALKTTYNSVFNTFELDGDETRIGVLKVSDFVSLFALFQDSVEFNFDEAEKSLTLSSGESSVTYQTADPDLIKEMKKSFPGKDWYTTFDYDSKFSSFNKGMSVLSNEECIIIEGDNLKSSVKMSVKNRGVSINSYSVKTTAQVTEPFEIAFKKEVMQLILGSKAESMKLSVCSNVVMIESKCKTSETTFIVAKLTAK